MERVSDEISLGKAAVSTGRYDEAIAHFDAAQDMLPADQTTFSSSQMAEASLSLQNAADAATDAAVKKEISAAAEKYARSALTYDPKNAAGHYILGKKAAESKDWPTALSEYTQAVQSDSSNYLYFYELGKVQYSMKKYSEARASFESAVKCNGSFAAAQFNLGVTLQTLGRRAEKHIPLIPCTVKLICMQPGF